MTAKQIHRVALALIILSTFVFFVGLLGFSGFGLPALFLDAGEELSEWAGYVFEMCLAFWTFATIFGVILLLVLQLIELGKQISSFITHIIKR
jgi:hypothetical protein